MIEEFYSVDEKDDLLIGQAIGHFVYEGRLNGESISVKTLDAIDKNKREIEILERLKPHPHENIVRYLGYRESVHFPPIWYVMMELCLPTNLHQFIIDKPDLTCKDRQTMLHQTSRGVRHLHKLNIVHRDLKPQNILISVDGKSTKICDFGLSELVDSTEGSGSVGTRGWWSPETKRGTNITKKSDIFSLGLTYYYVLSNGKRLDTEKCNNQQSIAVVLDLETAIIDTDSKDALRLMLQFNPCQRPDIRTMLQHQYFKDTKDSIASGDDVKSLHPCK